MKRIGAAGWLSAAVKSRPLFSGIPIVRKYPGITVRIVAEQFLAGPRRRTAGDSHPGARTQSRRTADSSPRSPTALPAAARSARTARAKNCVRRGSSGYRAAGIDTRNVSTFRASSPGSTDCNPTKLRNNSSAPTSSITESATSAPTSQDRSAPPPPMCERSPGRAAPRAS